MSDHLNKLRTGLLEGRQIWRREKNLALSKSRLLLEDLATRLCLPEQLENILEANRRDLEQLSVESPMYDRLLLDEKRLLSIAADLRRIAQLPSPVGELSYQHKMAGGVLVEKRRVPIGLLLVIYESRPNVTLDLFALALRTGNMLLLKGGKEAYQSNLAISKLLRECLQSHGLAPAWLTLLGTSREELHLLLRQHGLIDLCIPRGSAQLIDFVRENSRIPVIETGAGVVHLFCDESAELEKAAAVIANSKLRRLSVCNALDSLLLHQALLPQLAMLTAELAASEVKIWADALSYQALEQSYPARLLGRAEAQHYGCEFLSAQLLIHTVSSFEAALEQIAKHSSQHTEVILTQNPDHSKAFCEEVDSAAVFVNMASGFSDGGQFGLGAEVGISTQKLHARGPMGLEALTCEKWFGYGNGQIRS